MTTPIPTDPIALAGQQVLTGLLTRYSEAQLSNHVPDSWELVGLTVQLIEDGTPVLTGPQKYAAVKNVLLALLQQLPLAPIDKAKLEQELLQVDKLIEIALSLLHANAAVEAQIAKCTSCFKAQPKSVFIPFPVLKTI